VEDAERQCERCGVRKHTFLADPVGDMLMYLCEPLPWVKKVVTIAHNAKAFDLHFILNRAVLLKWQLEFIINGLKIMCMKMQHLVFLHSASFLQFPLRKLPGAFGLTASNSWYFYLFNRKENMDYLAPFPTFHAKARTTWEIRRGQSTSRGTRARETVLSTTGSCWRRTAKMTSTSSERRAECSGAS